MDSRVEIKTHGCKALYLCTHSSSLELEAWGGDHVETDLVTISFDMKNKEDEEAIRCLITHLQHQLHLHAGSNS